MRAATHAHLDGVTVRLRHGTATKDNPIVLRGDGEHFTVDYDPERASLDAAAMLTRVRLGIEGVRVAEIVLEDHDAHLTALYRACSKLDLNVEFTSGPLITGPVVKMCGEDPTYLIPEGCDLADALDRLPYAHFAAQRDAATGNLREFLGLLLEEFDRSGDSAGVCEWLLGAIERDRAEQAEARA